MNKGRSLIVLTIMLLITITIGLYNKQDIEEVSYDLAVIDKTKNYLFAESDNGLKLINTYVRYDTKTIVDRQHTLKADDGSVYWSAYSDNSKNYIIRANTNLTIDYFDTKGINIDTFTLDDQYIYSAQASDPIKLSRTERDFSNSYTTELLSDEQIVPVDMLVEGDYIYILVMQIDDTYKTPTSTYSLMKLDKDFNVIEKTDLSLQAMTSDTCKTKSDSSCSKMGTLASMLYYNGKFYFSETSSSSIAINEPIGSNKVWVYDVNGQSMSAIKLNTYFPYKMHLDAENGKIIVEHFSLFVKTHTYTIISMTDYSFKEIRFLEYEEVDVFDAYFVIKNNHYYFLFDDAIYKYDISGNLIYKHDLSQYNMEYPGIIF